MIRLQDDYVVQFDIRQGNGADLPNSFNLFVPPLTTLEHSNGAAKTITSSHAYCLHSIPNTSARINTIMEVYNSDVNKNALLIINQ